MKTDDIVKNGEILIPENMWKSMNENMSKEAIIKLVSDAIEQHNITLPYREVSIDGAKKDFEALSHMDCLKLIKRGEFFTRYDYSFSLNNCYVDQSNVGNKSSDYFHQVSRWKCDSINSPSPHRVWHSEKFKVSLLNSLWTLKQKKVDMGVLRSSLGLRKYIAAQFRPSAAKAIYQKCNPTYVLDFSTGWGDRLSAFMATKNPKYYFGCDPNQGLFAGYKAQIDTFCSSDKKVEIYNKPAEEMDFGSNCFDLAFTSPPYYIIERYTRESNQSWQRYKKIDDWLENFLYNTLNIVWRSLVKGGYLIVNISDVYCNHQVNKICGPMNIFISKLENAKYKGCIGLRMSKRPQSKSDKTGIFAEPMWVWKKS